MKPRLFRALAALAKNPPPHTAGKAGSLGAPAPQKRGAGRPLSRALCPGLAAGIGAGLMAALGLTLAARRRKIKAPGQADKKLADFTALSQTFIDASPSMALLKDAKLRHLWANRALREYCPATPEAPLGRGPFSLLEPEFAQLCQPGDLQVLATRQPVADTVVWRGRAYKMARFPVPLPDGAPGVGAYVGDMTAEHEERLGRERRLQGDRLLLEVLTGNFESRQALLDYALRQLLALSGSERGCLFLCDEARQELRLSAWSCQMPEAAGSAAAPPPACPLDQAGVWGEVVRQRKPLIINDVTTLKAPALDRGFPPGHLSPGRLMSAPVFFGGEIVAVIGFSGKPEDYHEADIAEITLLMSGVWSAVQRQTSLGRLACERSRHRQILMSIGDGVIVVGRDRRIEMLNPVASRLTGWQPEAAAGVPYGQVFVPSSAPRKGAEADNPIERVFATGQAQGPENLAILTAQNGQRYDLEASAAPILDDLGALAGVVLVFRDVTGKQKQQKKIEYMSFHDVLTGLYNRRFFEEELRRIDTPRNLPISILMGDLNGLKLTNDIFGHARGDLLLCRVADVMRCVCRTDDIIARWGGDEFVLLLPKTSGEEAAGIAQRIRNELSSQRVCPMGCGIALGCDTKTEAAQDILRALGNAETRMYSAKALERDEVQLHELNTLLHALAESSDREWCHAIQVGSLCQRLARALGLPESGVQMAMEAGRLHDIGKVALEPRLLEPGYQPTAAEWNGIIQHPVVGYRILNSFDETLELAEAVLSHHESWDGTGYPKGLSGEKIPLLARIIAAVESYDCMVSGAGGTPPKSEAEAVAELRRCAGTQFDPRVVAALAGLLEAETAEDKAGASQY